jgi:hypothetical protein
MSSSWQTVAALFVVALAAAWLVRTAVRKSRTPGCGSEGCGVVSPEAKALLRKLKKP